MDKAKEDQEQELLKANAALLHKREEIARLRENTLELVRNYLPTDMAAAVAEARKLEGTAAFDDAVKILEGGPRPQEVCKTCGNVKPVRFLRTLLRYIVVECEACVEREMTKRRQAEVEQVKRFLRENLIVYLAQRGMPDLYAVGLPERGIGSATLDSVPPAYQKLVEEDQGYYLTGSRGVGKTHLACALMREMIIRVEPREDPAGKINIYASDMPLFVSSPYLLMLIRDSFREGAEETERQIIERYSTVGVLILDDLGAEKTTPWVLQTLYVLINRRYESGLRTIITSNLSLQELGEQLGDRISSRVMEMCAVKVLKGPDRRLRR